MSKPQILLYGANGRIARLIRELAGERGIPLVLAGRDGQRIDATDGDAGGDARIFGLSTPSTIDDCLDDIKVVLNCAGPSRDTGLALFDACLRRGVDYLDLSDDVHVVEEFRAREDEIQAAKIMVLPSVGFSAVAADCLALHLVERLGHATELDLTFCDATGIIKTATETLIRRNGQLVAIPTGSRTRRIKRGDSSRLTTPVIAVELCTTYVSTAIPNITVWKTITQPERWALRALNALPETARVTKGLNKILAFGRMIAARKVVSKLPRATIIAEATAANGDSVRVQLETLDTALFTAHAALQIALRVATGTRRVGFTTPASLLGAGFVLSLPGVKRS